MPSVTKFRKIPDFVAGDKIRLSPIVKKWPFLAIFWQNRQKMNVFVLDEHFFSSIFAKNWNHLESLFFVCKKSAIFSVDRCKEFFIKSEKTVIFQWMHLDYIVFMHFCVKSSVDRKRCFLLKIVFFSQFLQKF